MTYPRSILRQSLLSVVACLLICAVFASELPEQLTLTNDTSNDYTLPSPTYPTISRTLGSVGQSAWHFITSGSIPHPNRFMPLNTEGRALQARVLFIFCSVLRT